MGNTRRVLLAIVVVIAVWLLAKGGTPMAVNLVATFLVGVGVTLAVTRVGVKK